MKKQCLPRQLLSSLLFQDLEFPSNFDLSQLKREIENLDGIQANVDVTINPSRSNIVLQQSEAIRTDIPHESDTATIVDKLASQLEELKAKYLSLQETVKNYDSKLIEVLI